MSQFKEFTKEFIKFWSSVRVAITLLALAAIATLIGSVLPQEITLSQDELIKNLSGSSFDILNILGYQNGADRFIFMKSLGLTNVFFSNWYLTLMLFMYLSIILASFTKVFPRAKGVFIFNPNPPRDSSSKNFVVKYKLNSKEAKLENLKELFKKQSYQITNADKKHNGFFARKGAVHKLGASVTHVGIILTITGACFGMFTGFGGFAVMSPGETMVLKNSEIKRIDNFWLGTVPDLKVKVIKTWKAEYDNGTPKQYYSILELYDNKTNQLIDKHLLKVNQPLKHKDFYIYQNTYGEYITVGFNNKTLDLGLQKMGDINVAMLEISPDFSFAIKPISDGEVEVNAIINRDIEQVIPIGIFKIGETADLGPPGQPVNFRYLGKSFVTGLQYKSNPGAGVLFLGFAILLLGVFIAFGSKRDLWVYENKGDIMILGKTDKFKKQFADEIQTYLKDFEGQTS